MRSALAALALVAAACRCGGAPAPPGPPYDGDVDQMADPYHGLPPRGGVPAIDRATALMNKVGEALGYGEAAGESLRAHADQPWAKRLVLFLDHGGTDQLEAAWTDLSGTLVAEPLPMSLKADVRRSQSRINDLHADEPTEDVVRRRLLAEIAWTLVELREGSVDAGR